MNNEDFTKLFRETANTHARQLKDMLSSNRHDPLLRALLTHPHGDGSNVDETIDDFIKRCDDPYPEKPSTDTKANG